MASLSSSTLYGSLVTSLYQGSTSSSTRLAYSTLQVLCQQSTVEISEQRTWRAPRRSFAVATVLAVLIESYNAQEAQAAREKVAEAPEKQSEEDKSLSAYDAKLLATNRRKEALKEQMAKLREKGKPIEKPAAVEPTSVSKPEPEAEPEPATSVAATASEAVKEAVESVLPSSE